MSAPKWQIDDLVYLEASARIGFLEAYKVSNVVNSRGRWIYTINVEQKPPAEPTIGDFIDIKKNRMLWFDESELIDFHEALLLVKHSLELKLNKVNALIHKYFPSGTGTEGA
jgi:hypothetical protein